MKLNSSSVAFGRHESFPLRYGWLTKGLNALVEDPKAFERDDSTVLLGVGKNMVAAIRYWLQACRVVKRNSRNFLELTPIGEIVFAEGGDPYLEDEGTIWLLHWLLATNATGATAIYWFFNHFHKPEFTSAEVATALRDFAKQNIESNVAAATLKGDAALLQRMYVKSTGTTRMPLEDALDSPLSVLNLQERLDTKTYRALPMDRRELPLGIFAFAVAELFDHLQSSELTIDQLMYSTLSHCAPGAVFRMTEDGLVRKVEELCAAYPDLLRIDNTAGIHQVYRIGELQPRTLLSAYYAETIAEVAA